MMQSLLGRALAVVACLMLAAGPALPAARAHPTPTARVAGITMARRGVRWSWAEGNGGADATRGAHAICVRLVTLGRAGRTKGNLTYGAVTYGCVG